MGQFGIGISGGLKPSTKDYAKLMQEIQNRPDMELLQTMILRSMQQAVYSPDNQGHFGLAYEAYTHFTSPIRRYPDLLVHRTIKAILSKKNYPVSNWSAMGEHCSMTERRADEASRDVSNWLKCYFMQDKVGEEFEGSVASVTSFGVFVALDDVYIEGLLHVTELGNDYFHFDQTQREMVGERTQVRYRMGDRLTIKVVRVDLETTKIDFSLVRKHDLGKKSPTSMKIDDVVGHVKRKSKSKKPANKAPSKKAARRTSQRRASKSTKPKKKR